MAKMLLKMVKTMGFCGDPVMLQILNFSNLQKLHIWPKISNLIQKYEQTRQIFKTFTKGRIIEAVILLRKRCQKAKLWNLNEKIKFCNFTKMLIQKNTMLRLMGL